MRKSIALFILFVFFVCKALHSQQNIQFDFSTQSIVGSLPDLKIGDFYRVNIQNINLNRWTVSISYEDTAITPLQTPSFSDINVDLLKKLVEGLSSSTTAPAELSLDQILQGGMMIGVMATVMARGGGGGTPGLHQALQNVTGTTQIDNRLKAEYQNLVQAEKNIIRLRGDLANISYDVGISRISSIQKVPVVNPTPAATIYANISGTIATLGGWITTVNNQFDAYCNWSTGQSLSTAIHTNADLALKKEFASWLKSATELYDTIALESHKWLNSIVSQNVSLGNYQSMPFQFTGDKTKLQIEIKPRSDDYLEQNYSFEVEFPLIRQTYQSVGLSFYYSDLTDDNYSTVEQMITDSTSSFSLVRETNKGEIGLASLFRWGSNLVKDSNAGVHFAFGPGLSITDRIRPRILFGGGLSIGRKHSVSIDFGGIVGFVSRLSNAFVEDTGYDSRPTSTTVTELDLGFFIGIGYVFKL